MALHGAALALALSLVPAPGSRIGDPATTLARISQQSEESPTFAALPAPAMPRALPPRMPVVSPSRLFQEAAPEWVPPAEPETEPESFAPADLPLTPPRMGPSLPARLKDITDSESTKAAAPASTPARTESGAAAPGPGEFTPPVLLEWEVPRSVKRGFRGRIVAVIELDAGGRAVSVRFDPGTGNPAFDARLENALKAARFKAARKGKVSLPCMLRQPIEFE